MAADATRLPPRRLAAFTVGCRGAVRSCRTWRGRRAPRSRNAGRALPAGRATTRSAWWFPTATRSTTAGDPRSPCRRPTCCRSGATPAGSPLGLHPRLTGLRSLFDEGRVAFIQRVGYQNSSRSHFLGTDIWSTANPNAPQGPGWLGRYLDTLPAPVDPLIVVGTWQAKRRTRCWRAPSACRRSPARPGYAFQSPNSGDRSADTSGRWRSDSRRTPAPARRTSRS